MQEIPCKHQKTLFTVQVIKENKFSQGDFGVSILRDAQNLTGHGPGQPCG